MEHHATQRFHSDSISIINRQASELKPDGDGTHIRAKKARADEARKEVSNLRRKEVIIVVDTLTRG